MGQIFGKIHNKQCCCDDVCASCCGGVYPTTSLFATFTLLNATPRCACLDGLSVELVFQGVIVNDLGECEVRWEGREARPCPNGLEFNIFFICRSSINGSAGSSELQIYLDSGPGTTQSDYINGTFDYYSSDCDPFEFCIRSNAGFPFELDQECGDGTVDDDAPQIEVCVTQ